MMYGAIFGDIVGSIYEFNNIKTKNFKLLDEDSFFTDDTVMTIAVGTALELTKGNRDELSKTTVATMQSLGLKYFDAGYGYNFKQWLLEDNPQPYNSWGNGAAMRISPVAYFADTLDEVKDLSYKITAISHNHPEGIKGAEATAVAIFLALQGKSKEEIKEHIMQNYYPLDFTLEEIRPTYKFSPSCQNTVPQALQAFFESENFEDAIRNAISIGGDSDTLAAITGSVAEAHYGVPENIKQFVINKLDNNLRQKLIYIENKHTNNADIKKPQDKSEEKKC